MKNANANHTIIHKQISSTKSLLVNDVGKRLFLLFDWHIDVILTEDIFYLGAKIL